MSGTIGSEVAKAAAKDGVGLEVKYGVVERVGAGRLYRHDPVLPSPLPLR